MTATEPLTAARAYEIDPTFRELVDVWVRERRCPLVLCDRCLELDLPNAAECARWAATEPEKMVARPCSSVGEIGTPCGPYPTAVSRGWFWVVERGRYGTPTAADVLGKNIPDELAHAPHDPSSFRLHESPLAAILWLLDNWQVPA